VDNSVLIDTSLDTMQFNYSINSTSPFSPFAFSVPQSQRNIKSPLMLSGSTQSKFSQLWRLRLHSVVHNCVLVHHNIHGMDVHLHIFIQLS